MRRGWGPRARALRAATALAGVLVLAADCVAGRSAVPGAPPTPAGSSSSSSGTPVPSTAATPSAGRTEPSAELVVEVHVPLTPAPGVGADEYPYPWIDDVEEHLGALDGSDGQEYDDGEELGGEYLFFLSGAPEDRLVRLAREVAHLDGVPEGAYAVVNDAEGTMGEGRRLELG